jgi:hypothetical protein
MIQCAIAARALERKCGWVLGREHQTWMMAEINKLIWGPPAPRSPLGKMDPEAFQRTADIAHKFGVIKKAADAGAYTHEIWDLALKKRRCASRIPHPADIATTQDPEPGASRSPINLDPWPFPGRGIQQVPRIRPLRSRNPLDKRRRRERSQKSRPPRHRTTLAAGPRAPAPGTPNAQLPPEFPQKTHLTPACFKPTLLIPIPRIRPRLVAVRAVAAAPVGGIEVEEHPGDRGGGARRRRHRA